MDCRFRRGRQALERGERSPARRARRRRGVWRDRGKDSMIFHDAKGRSIEIEGDYDVEAFHDGKRIGHLEFHDKDGGTSLWGMNVDAVYQKAGIGTEMMRLAAQLHGRRFGK